MKKILIILLTLVMLTGCGQLDNTSDDSVNMPDIVFLESVYNYNDGFIRIAFTDSNGDCYTSSDKEVCGSGFEELIEKYKSGSLDGKIIKSGSRNPEELQSNYKKLCETVSQNECNIVYPQELPDVETESYSWYGLYYDENDSLKSQIIHANECMTSLRSDNDIINEIYKWYTDSYTADSDMSGKMPDIVFLERVYRNADGFIKIGFTDINGDCYTSFDREVCGLGFAELIDKYKSGGLKGRIIKSGSRNPEELQSNYKKLCEAVSQNECNIVYPDSLSDVVEDSYSWYGLYYNKNGEFKTQVIHESECETFNSDCDAINEIYKWYNNSYTADSDVSVEMPDIVFLERVYNDNDGFIKIWFTASSGDFYTSDDKEVCSLSFEQLIYDYKYGSLDGRIKKFASCNVFFQQEEIWSNYKKLCEAVSQNECNIVYPQELPDVEADSYSWYGLYYDKNGEFKAQVIHQNECSTGLDSDCDAINEIYKWYDGNYVPVDD
ncbi:MAG: membrane lipoprotein lipid attachment site-containing protein [Ruminococcus sp.]|nr:membrane lipoprotein lipid attachment site-containing protein [Ruminococcus sp.]